MGNTGPVPPRASRDEATTGRRRGAGALRRRSENAVVVTEAGAAPPATPQNRRVVATARKQQGRDDDDDDDVEEKEETTTRAEAGGAAAGAPAAGKVLTVKMVMRRKDAEALVARLKAQSARERKARMAQLKGELRAGCSSGGGASRRHAPRRPMLPPIKENRFDHTPVV